MKNREASTGVGTRVAGAVGALVLAASLGACSTETSVPQPNHHSPSSSSQETFRQVDAIGGSVEAGYGAAKLLRGPKHLRHCGRTAASNAVLLANEMEKPVQMLACAGATTDDVLGKSHSKRQPEQLKRLRPHSLEGDLAVVDVGGNDVEVMQDWKACAMKGCDTAPMKGISQQRQHKLEQGIETIVQKVRNLGAKKVLVLGYFGLGSAGCLKAEGVTSYRETGQDRAEMGHWLDELNGSLRVGAERSGATFVDVEPAFKGHGICDENPWIGSIGGRNHGQFGHPNRTGQHELMSLEMQALLSPTSLPYIAHNSMGDALAVVG